MRAAPRQLFFIALLAISLAATGLAQSPPLEILSTSPLPPAAAGIPYSFQFEATGGFGQYTWSLVTDPFTGSPPPGLTLNSAGQLQGVPNTAGQFTFGIRITDQQQQTVTKSFVLTVAQFTIAPDPPLPTAFVGQTYTVSLTVPGGGRSFFSWSIIAGALPPGLALSAETGDIRGIPTEPGTFVWTVLAQDFDGASAVRQYSILVEGNPNQPPGLAVDLLPLHFSFASGSGPGTRGLRIRNTGGGEVPVTIEGSTQSTDDWISLAPQQGVVTAANPLEVLVAADPTQLGPGTFFGNVSVNNDSLAEGLQTGAPLTIGIPASMTISSRRQFLRLSLDGLTFTAVQGVAPVP